MNLQDLEKQIRDRMDTFPSKTRRVADYLLGNSSVVAFQSISEVAEKLSVSKAQLVRVARMLGFEGYAELKGILKKALLAQVLPSSAAEEVLDTHIPQDLCRLEQANLEETLNGLSSKSIVAFCEAAKKAKVIYCMGWGISALVTEWFFIRFTELGLKTVLMRRGSVSLMEQSRAIGEDNMLIVCELPSYVIEVKEAVEKIARRGAYIVTLTDSPAAPICGYSHLPFYVGDRSPTFGSSLIGPMYVVHVLTSVLAYNMGEQGRKALDAQREGLSDERVYYPAYGLRF